MSVQLGARDRHPVRGTPCANRRHWYADWHDARRGQHRHNAQDIFAPRHSLVVAPEAGVVAHVSSEATPRGGWTLTIRSGDRMYYFAHLQDNPIVSVGDRVRAGDPIGKVGSSGNASRTCPHLHLQAYVRRTRPRRYINLYDELRRVDPRLAGRAPAPPASEPPTQESHPCPNANN